MRTLAEAKEPIQCVDCNSELVDQEYCGDPFNSSHALVSTVTCLTPCAKWVKLPHTGVKHVIRTCASNLNIQFPLSLVCMKESRPGDGHLCLCEDSHCNSAPGAVLIGGRGGGASLYPVVLLGLVLVVLLQNLILRRRWESPGTSSKCKRSDTRDNGMQEMSADERGADGAREEDYNSASAAVSATECQHISDETWVHDSINGWMIGYDEWCMNAMGSRSTGCYQKERLGKDLYDMDCKHKLVPCVNVIIDTSYQASKILYTVLPDKNRQKNGSMCLTYHELGKPEKPGYYELKRKNNEVSARKPLDKQIMHACNSIISDTVGVNKLPTSVNSLRRRQKHTTTRLLVPQRHRHDKYHRQRNPMHRQHRHRAPVCTCTTKSPAPPSETLITPDSIAQVPYHYCSKVSP